MRYVFGALGVVAATVLLLVSAAMNWRFGFGLGKTEFDGQIYGAASAAADGLKALLPFFLVWALRQRAWLQMAAAALVWVVCTSYSLTSSLGFAALNRADTVGERVLKATEYQDLRTELKRAREKAGWIPKHRSVAEVEAALTAALMEPVRGKGRRVRGTVASLTKNCTVSNYWASRYCPNIFNLRKELAIAKDAEKLERRIAELRAKLAQVASASAVAEGDPQVALLSRLTGVDSAKVQMALVVLVSILVEIGSGLGFFVVLGGTRAMRPKRVLAVPQTGANDNLSEDESDLKVVEPTDELKAFYEERIEKAEGCSVTASLLYEDYCSWAAETGREPMTLPAFGRRFGELGIQKAKIAGRIRYIGVKLKNPAEVEATPKDVAEAPPTPEPKALQPRPLPAATTG